MTPTTAVTLRQLEYAVAVADERHFGRAAVRCAVSQSGLSTQIRALEQRLGVSLFERSKRQVALTAAGQHVIERARRILADVDDLARVADAHTGDVVGPLHLGVISTIARSVLPVAVAAINRIWPDARPQLGEYVADELVGLVDDGTLDLALLATPLDTRSLVVRPLVEDPFVVALPAGHPCADESPAELARLADLPMLLLEDRHCLGVHARSTCVLAGCGELIEVPSAGLSTLIQMVAAGAGATLVPRSAVAVEARPGSGVIVRPLARPTPTRTLAMGWRATDPRGPLFAAAADRLAGAVTELVC